jgi:hypothetical protein
VSIFLRNPTISNVSGLSRLRVQVIVAPEGRIHCAQRNEVVVAMIVDERRLSSFSACWTERNRTPAAGDARPPRRSHRRSQAIGIPNDTNRT